MNEISEALSKQFIFIVGAGRSGTTWLHRMLAAHPDVASLPGTELTVFTRYLAQPVSHFRREKEDLEAGRWSLGLGAIWSEDRFMLEVHRFLEHVYSEVLTARPGATHIMDKHPNYARHLPLIAELIPQARFIHLIRDGREVVVSALSVNKRVGHSAGEVGQAAREWEKFVSKAREDGKAIGERYLEIRYEDLKQDGPAVLGQVFKHCGLAADPEWVAGIIAENHISRKQFSSGDAALNALRTNPGAIWKERLSPTDRYRVDKWAGALLYDLGYAEAGWWSESLWMHWSIALRSFLWRIGRAFQGGIRSWRLAAIDPFEPLRAWRRS